MYSSLVILEATLEAPYQSWLTTTDFGVHLSEGRLTVTFRAGVRKCYIWEMD